MQVAAYYFPNYHPGDARNSRLFSPAWSEWELVKTAIPRFPGHPQPRVPLWGYTDESDPAQMAQKIGAAADHGLDAFIFDWYHYNDGPFLDRALDRGFLRAPNNHRLKFALMWANHDWEHIHTAKPGGNYRKLYPGEISPTAWDSITDMIVEKYLLHPRYWWVEGKPYFSFYDLGKLVAGLGSVGETRKALDRFRQKAIARGLPGINLNAIVWGQPVLPAEDSNIKPEQLVPALGFDSVSTYVWLHHAGLPHFPTNDYVEWQTAYFAYWDRAAKELPVPYYPNVSVGWDSSPRTDPTLPWQSGHYPYTPVISNNTPENFRKALEAARQRLLKAPLDQQILTINSWNEWTEGSYLEPDTLHGMRYLESIRSTFGNRS